MLCTLISVSRRLCFINHFFEKLLKLKGLMLTEPGRIEAENRHQIMVDFLRAYFHEKNAPEWSDFLEEYLRSIDVYDRLNLVY